MSGLHLLIFQKKERTACFENEMEGQALKPAGVKFMSY